MPTERALTLDNCEAVYLQKVEVVSVKPRKTLVDRLLNLRCRHSHEIPTVAQVPAYVAYRKRETIVYVALRLSVVLPNLHDVITTSIVEVLLLLASIVHHVVLESSY